MILLHNYNLITIDVWGTIFKSSTPTFKPNIPNWEESVKKVKLRYKDHHKKPNSLEYVREILKEANSKENSIVIHNEIIDNYIKNPPVELIDKNIPYIIKNLILSGKDVVILSNTGTFMTHHVLVKVLDKFGINCPVVGSDLIGLYKPDPNFYKSALLDYELNNKWVHIGDSLELDINPVTKLGGHTIHITKEKSWKEQLHTV